MRKIALTVLPVMILAFGVSTLTGCKSKWVTKAQEIEKAACACKDVECAKKQQKALNEYIKETKGVKVKKKDAGKVAKAVLKAQTCISKQMIGDTLKKLKIKTVPKRVEPKRVAPMVVAPKADAPKADAPKKDAPKKDAPKKK